MEKDELHKAVQNAIDMIRSGIEIPSSPELDKLHKDFEKMKQEMDDLNVGFHTPCPHSKITVSFNKEEADKCKTWEDLFEKFPRKQCPDCGATVYASYEHYLYGDW